VHRAGRIAGLVGAEGAELAIGGGGAGAEGGALGPAAPALLGLVAAGIFGGADEDDDVVGAVGAPAVQEEPGRAGQLQVQLAEGPGPAPREAPDHGQARSLASGPADLLALQELQHAQGGAGILAEVQLAFLLLAGDGLGREVAAGAEGAEGAEAEEGGEEQQAEDAGPEELPGALAAGQGRRCAEEQGPGLGAGSEQGAPRGDDARARPAVQRLAGGRGDGGGA
jgi:hypothetical protein